MRAVAGGSGRAGAAAAGRISEAAHDKLFILGRNSFAIGRVRVGVECASGVPAAAAAATGRPPPQQQRVRRVGLAREDLLPALERLRPAGSL